ncbi:MDR family MFS transporter [Streptacidiphilus sp. N1-12]|uniref:MDR family MFS transporter n=2 Tax=Streptacidiphilus alkalitolerans TaxID=3342712 RepID=A0ABV6VHG8_9ACTN
MADTKPLSTAEADAPVVLGRSVYIAVFGLMLGMLMAMLDNLIVSTALPTIVGDLGGLSHLSWVVTAYALGAAVTTPVWGKLGDLYGRKPIFMIAIVLFLIGSALTGLAQNMDQLIAFRALQGLGAGGLMVGAMAVLGDLVPPRERGRFQAMIGGMMPVAFVGGPLVGGLLTEHLSWRWCFYINLPLGIAALLVTGLGMKLPRQHIEARIDYLGAALLGLGVVAITLVASWGGNQYAWGSTVIIALALGGVVALIAFVYSQSRVAEPILPPSMFRDRNFTTAQIISFLVGAAMFGAINFLPQYLQYVRGASPTASGLLLLPLMFGMLAVMIGSGQVVSRTGKYRTLMLVGGAVMTAGMALLLVLKVDTSTVSASLLTTVLGLGMGFLMQNTMLITQNSVPLRNMGAASGAVTLFRTVGGSLGIAVFGSLYTQRLTSSLTKSLGPSGHQLAANGTRIPPSALPGLPAPVQHAFKVAVTDGLHSVLIGGTVLALLTFLVTFLIREVPLRSGAAPGAPLE